MKKALDLLRCWLIRKLGGFVFPAEGTVIQASNRKIVTMTATLVIDPLMSRELQTERVACKLARGLLDEGLVCFTSEQRGDQSFFTSIRATVRVISPEENNV